MKIAIVTGASSGMGREFVRQIARKYRTIEEIWIIARRKERLEELSEELSDIRIRIFAVDLTDDKSLREIEDALSKDKPSVRILVNASGYGMIGRFEELSSDNIGMVDINCTALTKMINIALPYMSNGNGNIINIASSAAFLPQPSFAVYAATKSYVLNLSRALNQELKPRGISVTAVCPGPVATEFFDIAETYNNVKMYKKLFKAKPEKVVETALKDTFHGKTVSVYGFTMKAFRILCKFLPKDFIIKFIK
ncbi:MAG: SDR family NAD(P)-dependent oxidoreductase [Lachnospiraceae bacterium]|nr:SDR family NAD(P)-dependent oxidoreductase [Lachnospiraceae bacterium]